MTEEISGGALVARCLASEGVSHVFGLPCPELDPILAALDQQRIRFVPVRHESAAVFMALGLYKTAGQVAAVVGNPGPGSANLLPGVLNALHEGVPVIVLTAQHRLGLVYPSSPATFQGQDQLDLFRPVVKWGGPILSFERIPEVMRLAFRELWAGRPGPIHLEVPGPVLYATGGAPPLLTPEQYRAALPQASEADLERAAELLAQAEHPIAIAGSGVDRADANALLLEIVKLIGCPVLTSMAGRAAVPSDHPNFVYGFGAGADALKREADVVLAVGTRLGNLDLPYDKYWGAGQKVIQIDIDPRNLGVTRPLALGIVADAKNSLDGLLRALRRRSVRGYDAKALAAHRERAHAWWRAQFEAVAKWSGPGIHPAHAMQSVGRVFGRDAVYMVDGGNTSLWAHWFLPPTQPRSWHGILELGMLGTGVPSSIGAKFGLPGRDVVCVTGDDRSFRRGIVDDGGAERKASLGQNLRYRDGRRALGRRGTGPRLPGRVRGSARGPRTCPRACTRSRCPRRRVREDQPRREPRDAARASRAVRGGVSGAALLESVTRGGVPHVCNPNVLRSCVSVRRKSFFDCLPVVNTRNPRPQVQSPATEARRWAPRAASAPRRRSPIAALSPSGLV